MDISDFIDALSPGDQSLPSATSQVKHFVKGATNAINSLQPSPAPVGHPPPNASGPSNFAYLQHLPMFTIEQTAAEAQAIQERQNNKARAQSRIKHVGASDKVAFKVLGAATGVHVTAGIEFENSLHKMKIASSNFGMTESFMAAVTRFAALPVADGTAAPAGPLLVDVFEVRPHKSWMGQKICVRANRCVRLRVRGEWEVKLKSAGDCWSKTATTIAPVNEITVLVGGEVESGSKGGLFRRKKQPETPNVAPQGEIAVPMELVIRLERLIAPAERHTMQKRFEKEWSVPVVA